MVSLNSRETSEKVHAGALFRDCRFSTMTGALEPPHVGVAHIRAQHIATRLCTFLLSGLSSLAPMAAAAYESFNWVRLGAVLILLILLHIFMRPTLQFSRELALYAAFFAYMSISSIWAPDIAVGMNTLLPAVDCVLIMILFGSLVAFHEVRWVLSGMLAGFLLGAFIYTRTFGFPLVYPLGFSYNAIAGMYLFGLLSALFYAWHTRSKFFPLLFSLVIMAHIAATTSIKTNLGIVLGAGAAAIVYVGSVLRTLLRNVVLLGILTAALVYVIMSSDALLDRVQSGLDRVSHGVEILQQREDVAGNTSFGERADWGNQGVKGWLRSPLFGNGVEAFRVDYGITSHSTPVDLLYNFGVIGCVLFYAIFVSMLFRLMAAHTTQLGSLPALIFGGIVCYVFISLSGTMHYNLFMTVFISLSVGLLRRSGACPQLADKSEGPS